MAEYIEREKLQEALQRKKSGPANIKFTDGWNDCLLRVKSMVHSAPAADVEPVRRGRWIVLGQRTYGGGRHYTHYCSKCWQHGFDDFKRCPNCGARMDLGGADNGE